ncbi:MAG: hypothetical protein M1831_003211 [Alyxoria varia]|nr:MAG: hypothetical protein M1831_003211 [Alyxoria varia]
MSTIKAIEGRSVGSKLHKDEWVHQIQSGQVIIDLCSVVKELVENSLDAGATSIDIRFKSHGLEAIEVQDNGKGIAHEDYETICLKHYTSKLSAYEDLTSVDTFGFRGEALSSLCALSKLHIITAKDGDAPRGSRLDFESSGKLQSTGVAPCQRGTTIVAENLFHTLPVRRRGLEKNIKREYARVVGVLNAYACVSTGVKFSVSNQPAKGKKISVFSTKSNLSVKDNIANVYGAKTVTALVPLELKLELQSTGPSQALAGLHRSSQSTNGKKVHVSGQISRPVHGEGRQTPDRQMFFVNSRPCGLPQMAKAFNEVYKSYNVTQSPFIFANFQMDTNAYDVNVSPDKRTILLHDQGPLLESLKENLVHLFEAQDQTVPQAMPTAKLPAFQPPSISRESTRDSVVTPDRGRQSEIRDADAEPRLNTQSTATSSSAASSSMTDTQSGQASQLLSKFVARNAFERRDTNGTNKSLNHPTHESSKGKQRLAVKLGVRDSHFKESHEATEPQQEGESDDEEESNQQPFELPRIAQDFNARLASQRPKDDAARQNEIAERRTSFTAHQDRRSDAAKTLTKPFSAQKVSKPDREARQSPAARGSDAGEEHEIDEPPLKRPRTEGDSDARGAERSKQAVSRFPNGLSAFAAPGTQVNLDAPPESSIKNYLKQNEEDQGEGSSVDEVSEQGDIEHDQRSESDDVDAVEEPVGHGEADSDDDYIDEAEKKRQEEARVQEMVRQAEESAAHPSRENERRASNLLQPRQDKETTANIVKRLDIDVTSIEAQAKRLHRSMQALAGVQKSSSTPDHEEEEGDPPPAKAVSDEERLSLTICKSDFANMNIIGQFNLGFILAVRSSSSSSLAGTQKQPMPPPPTRRTARNNNDELFIIDQHASDEIYNFSRLSSSTTLTPQPLVTPHVLQLTAIEEETILAHREHSLAKNGFVIDVDLSGESEVGRRCRLKTLPTSRETVFDTRDLEELLSLLAEVPGPATLLPEDAEAADDDDGDEDDPHTTTHTAKSSSHTATNLTTDHSIVRPSKVRRTLAMRACRSSVMVGKPLNRKGMERVVRNMGTIERPWNCPHGRPTMRHLCGLGDLGVWRGDGGVADEGGGDEDWVGGGWGVDGRTDWRGWLEGVEGDGGDEEIEARDEDEDEDGGEETHDEEREKEEEITKGTNIDEYDEYEAEAGEGVGDIGELQQTDTPT